MHEHIINIYSFHPVPPPKRYQNILQNTRPISSPGRTKEMLLGCAVNDCFALRIKFVGGANQVQKGHHAANLTMQPNGSCTHLVPMVLGMQ